MPRSPVRGKGFALRTAGRNVSRKFTSLPCHDRMKFAERSQGQAIVEGTWPSTVPPGQQNPFFQNLQPRMFVIKVKQDRKHRGAGRHVRGKPAVVGTVDLLGKSVFPQALTGEIGPSARQPSSGQPCQTRKVEYIRLVEQVTLPGFFGFPEGGQDLTNESLLIQAMFPRAKRFAQVRSQPRQENLINLKTRLPGFHQKTRSVTSRPKVRILSSRPISQTARSRLHQLQSPDSRPYGLLRELGLSAIKQSGSVKHGHGLARGLLRATIRKTKEFVEGRNQFGHRGRGNRHGSEQAVGKEPFRRRKSHLLPGLQNKSPVLRVK